MSATRLIAPNFVGLVRSPGKGPLPSKNVKFHRQFSSSSLGNRPQASPLKALRSQQASQGITQSLHNAIGRNSKRFYSSEIAGAMVEVSQNIGMGAGAIGLGGAGIGIGIVFSALLQGVARNPGMRGQLFTYAILGFAFVEAMGLLELVTALMIKFV